MKIAIAAFALLAMSPLSAQASKLPSDISIDLQVEQAAPFTLPELSTQAKVYTAQFSARRDAEWVKSCLNASLDIKKLGCKIVAYRIQWFSGQWSSWFVPGVNDLYKKSGEPLRRYWACFNDHKFQIIYQTHGKQILSNLKKEKLDLQPEMEMDVFAD